MLTAALPCSSLSTWVSARDAHRATRPAGVCPWNSEGYPSMPPSGFLLSRKLLPRKEPQVSKRLTAPSLTASWLRARPSPPPRLRRALFSPFYR